MAGGKRISELDLVSSLDGTESIEVVQSGGNKRATTSLFARIAQLGTNWWTALTTALGSSWATAFASALGSGWTTALASELGSGWTTALGLSTGRFSTGKDGDKVGLIIKYSASDSLILEKGKYHFSDGSNDYWVNIASDVTINSSTSNYPSAGAGTYVCGDSSGNISLEAATATASTRPSDIGFSYNGGNGSYINLGRKGYYINGKRILAFFWKISATSFYLINLGSGQVENGENGNGGYEIDSLGTMRCHYKNSSALTCNTAYASPLYMSASWIPGYPVPFKTGSLPDVTPGISESAGNFCMVSAAGTPSVSIPAEFKVIGPSGASAKINYTAIGKRPD